METHARYIIGIDLGTTNSCVAYVDTDPKKNPSLSIQSFSIKQLGPSGALTSLHTFPSCYYLAASHEYQQGSLDLPWAKERDYFVGSYAQHYGANIPTRLIRSAKSWLSYPGANRKDPILPLECTDPDRKLSPVKVSAAYLQHIREAWDQTMGKGDVEREFSQQEVVLTVPASFDEVARQLTLEAAKTAGYGGVTLIEEPQAAFYHWISKHEKRWKENLVPEETILVCDVGGGTCDFSWIKVEEDSFQRLSVGNHLLLGGDNMDIAISHFLEKKLDVSLTSEQWPLLVEQARQAKELLLNESGKKSHLIVIQGTGSSVIKGALTLEVTKEEIQDFLVEGFFKVYPLDQAKQLKKSSGIRTVGLPYETEPNISKHIASFLSQAEAMGEEPCPDYLLFNGGTMKANIYQKSVLDSFEKWFNKTPKVLPSDNLDLAVSRGAAYFGKVRRGLGTRIGGGIPRAYYLEVKVKDKDQTQALTLLERGTEEGTKVSSEQTFHLAANVPVAFQLLSSTTRLKDKRGDLLSIDEESFQLLPSIQTVLNFGKKRVSKEKLVDVALHTHLTEIGLLELWLHSLETPHKWKLEFQLKSASGQENRLEELKDARKDEQFDESFLEPAQKVIIHTFSKERALKPTHVMQALEEHLEQPRNEWPPSILRSLWSTLHDQAPFRKESSVYEARWWNLAGFLLRPGYGYPLDDHRMKELWRMSLEKTQHFDHQDCVLQRFICYRRLAGGLKKGQQQQISKQLLHTLLSKKGNTFIFKTRRDRYEYQEKIRLLAAFERLEVKEKVRLGNALVQRVLSDEAHYCDYWALGRLGARHLVYGSVAEVIPKHECEKWLQILLKANLKDKDALVFLIGQLARQTKLREINISPTLAKDILGHYKCSSIYHRLQHYIEGKGPLSEKEQEELIGDQIPSGLTIAI